MKKALFLALLVIGAVYLYCYYVLGVDMLSRQRFEPSLPQYAYADKVPRSGKGYWMRAAALPEPRAGVAAASVGNRLFAVGGLDQYGRTSAGVYVYDIFTDTWTKASPLPVARHHIALVAYGDKLYAIGGLVGVVSRASDAVSVYDSVRDIWTAGPSLPEPVGAASAVVYDNAIHVFGGRNSFGALGSHFILDPLSETWTRGEDMVSLRDGMVGEVVGRDVYLIGGRYGSAAESSASTEDFDIDRQTWDSKAPMPTRRDGSGGAVIGGKIYVLGGESSGEVAGGVESFDPATNTWTATAAMPVPRHGFGAAAVNGMIFTVGGGRRPFFSVSDLNEVFVP